VRSEIVKQLRKDLSNHLSLANGYKTDIVEIKFGVVSFNQFAQRPALGYWCYSDEIDEEQYEEKRLRWCNFLIYGYTDDDFQSDYENIFNFADDVEKFLYSEDWTYHESTLLGNLVCKPGETDQGRAMFELEMKVGYYQDDQL